MANIVLQSYRYGNVLALKCFVRPPIFELQWNLSKEDTYGTEVFARFREVSALKMFELKSSQI